MFWLIPLAIVIAIFLFGGVVFFIACSRYKELPWLDEAKMRKTPYGEYYDSIVAADKWLREHNVQEVSVTSTDGLQLKGYWVPVKNARGTMLMAHGYRSSMLLDMGYVFDFYRERGMNLLIPFQRAHGKSEGKYITFGVKERGDMLCWLKYHNDRFGNLPVILTGISMGASTMLYLADEPLPENVRGIIADCGFTSPKAIISRVFRAVIHLPAVPFIWVADLFARLFAGFGLTQKDSRKTLTKNKLPILLIHGADDDFVPCDMTKQAYDVCTGPKQLFLVEGAKHGTSFLVETKRYSELVENFLNENLR